ncbi:hypothetical protein CEQ90_16470 [Lewinellaceae bacterium SD302]|nr:hypothetical protein CEQ90_16470 [Lewinellaceae bacterium SD302]
MEPSQIRPYRVEYDLANCDAEPLHLIRHFQGHAVLIVVDAESLLIKACSTNLAELTDRGLQDIIESDCRLIFDQETIEMITSIIQTEQYADHNPIELPLWRNELCPYGANLIMHHNGRFLVLELEPRDPQAAASAFLLKVDKSLQRISNVVNGENLYDTLVTEVRRLSDFDRVMLYKFDEAYNGDVVAEAKLTELPPYLNLRYPHTDIPKQARDLYLRTAVRHIVDTNPARISGVVSAANLPDIDLALSANRGSSPIHLEYLKNIGVGATMSIAIILEGKLWGLVACHHGSPKLIDYRLRSVFAMMGNIMSSHLALRESNKFRDQMLRTSLIRARLFDKMREEADIFRGLTGASSKLTKLMEAEGAAILLDDKITLIGKCPPEDIVLQLTRWLEIKQDSLYHTHVLEKELEEEDWFAGEVGGLLAIRLGFDSGEYILWFRPKIVETVHWGGDPAARKLVENGKVRLNPEISFAKWKEETRGKSRKWGRHHLDAAVALRNDVKEIILEKYQEVRRENSELSSAYGSLENYSYTVSHDLRAPLRNIKGFAEILWEDYGNLLDETGKYAIQTITDSVGKMERLIDDILKFSKVGSKEMELTEIDLRDLLMDIWEDHRPSHDVISLQLELSQQTIFGDRNRIRQMFANLISNSIKYARQSEEGSWIKITSTGNNGHCYFEVTDNGIGFDMRYAEGIFNVFNRLVSEDKYEGSGVGLAIVHRVVELHDGEITVDSKPGTGTDFKISLPNQPVSKSK